LVAPISMAVLFDITGNYDLAFVLAFGVAAASIGLFWAAKPPALPRHPLLMSGISGGGLDMVEPRS
jgi:hypothetical protein